MAQAIVASPATKVYICNLMTQANESLGLTAADHIRALNRHAQKQISDYALLNRTPASEELKIKYASEGACQIVNDLEALESDRRYSGSWRLSGRRSRRRPPQYLPRVSRSDAVGAPPNFRTRKLNRILLLCFHGLRL